MTFTAFLAFTGAALCGGLTVFVFLENSRDFIHRVFAVGMGALALMQICVGMEAQAVLPTDTTFWEGLGLVATAFVPGSWLLFSLGFARKNYKEVITKWRWVVLGAFVAPLALVTFFRHALFVDTLRFDVSSGWVIPLGWSGYLFHLCLLLVSVVILMNLERTLRVSTGSMRWRIKFILFGVGSLFAVQIYTSSQVLLFSSIAMTSKAVAAFAVIVASALVIVSLIRHRLLNVDIQLSRTVFYNSITVFIVGVYLLAVGVFAKVIDYFGSSKALPLGTLFVFLASVGLTIVLLSDQLRQQLKQVISRHVYHSRYDYRQAWTTFTQRTTSVIEVQELCAVVTKMVSETFSVPAVTIWLFDEEFPDHVTMGGSTAFSDPQAPIWVGAEQSAMDLVTYMQDHQMPVDFTKTQDSQARELKWAHPDYFRRARLRYCVSLGTGQQFLGLMTLNDRLSKEPFSLEDCTLLKTLADQAAASLLNLKLSQRLLKAKEMEAFQTLSAFFVHDLKNLAARLSLMVQNLPAHYDNPAFRDDMLRVISGSVAKMNAMCSRLSLLTQKIELHRIDTDLNALVSTTLVDVKDSLKVPLSQELCPIPQLTIDTEQFQKVLLNLILNANEAAGRHGEIRVKTDWVDGWAVLLVSDNGCGMSKEFIDRSLFQPFQTTKSQGLGIGLFHSKMIVEAHRGRIEVESEEGKGSTFRIFIPGSARDY
jgi:putative PEP-CTERM system histidine kinase